MRKQWQPQEDDFLHANYQELTPAQMSLEMSRTASAIKNRVHKLGLRLDRSTIFSSRLGYYEKGQEPMNKGKKMSEELYEKVKHTMFPKGNKPHNTRIKGEFSDRADKTGAVYRHIKIDDAQWVPYHRFIWEQNFGEIPDDCIILFKDGNSMNFAIENLEMISKAENMQRNRIHNLPPEMKEIIKLNNKLKKELKNAD